MVGRARPQGSSPALAALLASPLALLATGSGAGSGARWGGRSIRTEAARTVTASVSPNGMVAALGPRDRPGAEAPLGFSDASARANEAGLLPPGASLSQADGGGGGPSTTTATVPGGYCAMEGRNCTCEGVVGYGHGHKQLFRRTSGVVPCMGPFFGKEEGSPEYGCVCYSMEWCAAKVRGDRTKIMDQPHRRRSTSDRLGQGMHQRRRWCGFGPRNCAWGEWRSWGACSATCGQGTRKRTRSQTRGPENGGSCNGDLENKKPCHRLPPCANAPSEKSGPAEAKASVPGPTTTS